MNNITSALASRNWQKQEANLAKLIRHRDKSPEDAVLFENRRLELIQSMPLQRVKIRRSA